MLRGALEGKIQNENCQKRICFEGIIFEYQMTLINDFTVENKIK
jgi:hypothetical protein